MFQVINRYAVPSFFIGLLSALPGTAPAQTTLGNILGTVSDASGAVVAAAPVTTVNLGTGARRTVSTNADGFYDVSHLEPGEYRLSVEMAGFKRFVWDRALLESNRQLRIDVKLEIGNVSESVEVVARAPVIETESGRISNVVEYRVLRDVKQGGRGTYNWLSLTPGAFYNGNGYTINGSRSAANGYNLDGVSVGNPVNGREIDSMRPDPEMVREVKVDSVNNNAEFAYAGSVSSTTMSGTNSFHGQASWNHQNGALNARNPFSTTRAPGFPINNWFFSMGGPVRLPRLYDGRNRTFFFFHHDGQERTAAAARVYNVPTTAMRAGDFSAVGAVRDPSTGQPFPGNVIPAGRINPSARWYLDRFYPRPTVATARPASNFLQNMKDGDVRSDRAWSIRFDQQVGTRNNLFFRYWTNSFDFRNLDSALPPEILGYRHRLKKTRSATLADTHIFSAAVINELRIGFARHNQDRHAVLRGRSVVEEMGLRGYPALLNPDTYGMPNVSMPGLLSISAQATSLETQNVYNIRDNLTFVLRSHSFKAGVDLLRGEDAQYPVSPSQQFGVFNFDGFASGQPFGDFLLGLPRTALRAYELSRYYGRGYEWALFFQDEWKARRNLTLTYGLRFERHNPWTDRQDRIYNFDPATGGIVVPNARVAALVHPLFPKEIPIVTADRAGMPERALVGTDTSDFAPRFGFAWRTGAGGLVVRGGYGLFYSFESSKRFPNMTGGPFVAQEVYDNSLTGGIPRFAWPQAFPAGAARALGAVSVDGTALNLFSSYTHQWNLTLERQFQEYGVRLSYIGTQAAQLPYRLDLNQPRPGTTPFAQNLRPYPAYRSIGMFTRGANQSYNALQAEVTRRFSGGFMLDAHYTYAKNLTDSQDNNNAGGQIEDAYDREREWGNNPGMPRQRLLAVVIWDVPVGRGRKHLSKSHPLVDAIAGGWSISANFGANTGQWLTPTFTGRDISNTNVTGGRPDRVCDGNLPSDQRSTGRWFDAGCFVVPPASSGRFGNAGRAIIESPGFWGVNTNFMKYFRLPGRETNRFRLQALVQNLLNHPRFGNPDLNVVAAGVGTIRATAASAGVTDIAPARVVELGIRFEW